MMLPTFREPLTNAVGVLYIQVSFFVLLPRHPGQATLLVPEWVNGVCLVGGDSDSLLSYTCYGCLCCHILGTSPPAHRRNTVVKN
jgi:hypothetical protein